MSNTNTSSSASPARRFDLHTHSLQSDGTLTPAELVTRARAAGVDVLALTDHDVTDGIAEARTTAVSLGMKLIAGVESSVTWQAQTVHIVGLNIDTADHSLQQGLARLREFRQWRAVEIGRRLQKKRIEGAYEGARRLAKGKIVSRTHFARFLVEQGYVRGMQQAFKQFLGGGKPGHVPGQWATLGEAVSWIRSAGGQAVVAHPARYKLSAGKLLRLFGEFRECGGEAIEVISAIRLSPIGISRALPPSRIFSLRPVPIITVRKKPGWISAGCRPCRMAVFPSGGTGNSPDRPCTRPRQEACPRATWPSIFKFIRRIRSRA
jgi:predicted metal-dependent phosphoesterase TrpH